MCFYLRNWQVTFLLYTLGVFISEYTAKAFTEPRDYRVVFLIQEKLRSMLDQEAATVLDKMICLQAAIAGMTAEEYFIDGLRTGFRLALAILDEEENGLLKPISDGGKQP